MKLTMKSFGDKVNDGVQIVLVGALTGAFAGVVVTLYQIVFELCEEFSAGYYGFFRSRPAFIPLLFLALFLGSVVIGGVMKFLPMIRGSGFPQTEGATQGLLRFKWYKVLTGMFAASLFVVFAGLSGGSEGPSLMIGGACGDGVSSVLRRNAVVRRYQITGGACAGLAVALNAPLTGMIFAYEEAHKRFTPEVFICSFSAVSVAIVVRNLLRPAMGLAVGPFFAGYAIPADTGLRFSLYALLTALIVSLVGALFYYAVFAIRRRYKKFNPWKGYGRYAIPFLFAGVCGLVSVFATGSGLELIEGLSAGSEHTMSVFGAPLFVSLLIILVLKFLTTSLNTASDLPCCASVPMMAMGAVVGKLLSLFFVRLGMPGELTDALVVIAMVTFFTTVVHAPMTGIIMTVELTWSFTFLLPAVLSVAVGYLVGSVLHMEPLYERLLDEILEERRAHTEEVTAEIVVRAAAGKEIRNILWPFSALVTKIERGDEALIPGGSTVLLEGDRITVEGRPEDREEYLSALASVVGELVSSPSDPPSDPPSSPSDPDAPDPSSGGETQ